MAFTPTPATIARYGHIVVFLREEMKKRDWGPADLTKALELGDKNTRIYPWLRGSGAPGPDLRAKLGALFQVPEETFMAREISGAVVREKPSAMIAKAMALPAPKPQDVLTFNVTSDGQARLRLDATLPLAVAAPLLRMLLDAGLVFGQDEPASG